MTDDDVLVFVVLPLLGLAISLFPWLAVMSADGRWGIAAQVLGIAFIAISLVAQIVANIGTLLAFPWVLYLFYLFGYWSLAGKLFGWFDLTGEPPWNGMSGFDGVATFCLSWIGAAAQAAITVGIPVILAMAIAHGSNLVLAARGHRRNAEARDRAADGRASDR